MNREAAAELLETHRNWRKGLIGDYEFNAAFTLQEGDEAVDLAIAALREQPAPEQPAENDLCSLAKRVADGMVGIGGIPDKEEFYAEFASRLWDALGFQPLQFEDLAIAALREGVEPAPAELTKEQYIELSRIFHGQHDEWDAAKDGIIPTASFSAVVGMVEKFLKMPGAEAAPADLKKT